MKFSNVRLLVKDFAKCFKFYSEQLGLEPAWGDENSGYAYFKVADGIEGFALFVSDWMHHTNSGSGILGVNHAKRGKSFCMSSKRSICGYISTSNGCGSYE